MKKIFNGKIWTGREFCETVLIEDGRIAFAGSEEDAKAIETADESVEAIDLEGKTVLPGFCDCHAHGGMKSVSEECHLAIGDEVESAEDCIEDIRKYVNEHPDLDFYKGTGWPSPFFENGSPDRKVLDEITGDVPAAISSKECHTIWANTKAIELAGITADTPDPPGGHIARDEEGNLSGAFMDEAQGLINAIVPDFTVEEYKESIMTYQQDMLIYGYTLLTEMLIKKDSNLHKAYEELADEGKLLIKTELAFHVEPASYEEDVAALGKADMTVRNRLVTGRYAKIFVDGVLEGRTAWLKEAYADEEGFFGAHLWTDEQLFGACQALDKAGYDVHFHVIGDRAFQQVVDVMEKVAEANGVKERRPVIAHAQLADKEDIKRFAALGGVFASNPYWFFTDQVYTYSNEIPLLGEERQKTQYPMKSFADEGIVIASGSDYPITPWPSSLFAMKTGMQRVYAEMPGDDTETLFRPEERVSFDVMLNSVTEGGAYSLGLEEITGTLEEGKMADLVVLTGDLFETDPDEYAGIEVDMLISEGDIIYRQ
ncbi:MAG: amidohydrolase [Bacillota bacterium]|nr:amidohydrolase [Bacillota bacterium]